MMNFTADNALKTMDCYPAGKHSGLSPESQSEASCSYSLRAHKENPLKRKKMNLLHEEPESQLMGTPTKRMRTETGEKKVKKRKTGARPVKKTDSSPKGSPLSPEMQPEASCSYSLRARKENPLKRKEVDLHEESESQLMERPAKRMRTETGENTGTPSVKESNTLPQAGELSPESQSEASCSYFLRARKENPLKRKKMDESSERPKKRGRTETEEKKETGPVKRQKTGAGPKKSDTLLQNSSSSEEDPEPSCSPGFQSIRDELYERPDPQPEDLPEEFSERYTIGKRLGRGSFANVYAGVRKSDGAKVAIKYLFMDTTSHFTPPGHTRKLPREVVASKFVCRPYSSPYVIRMLDWFETPNGFLLVMERAYKCITLYKLLKRLDGKLPEEMARIIMWKLVKAVNHCRKSGVLHEDIKTDNILVNPETLELKLVDFGLVTIIKDIRLNEFGGNEFYLPLLWICERPHWCVYLPELELIRKVGGFLYYMTSGSYADGLQLAFKDGQSEACINLIKWCLHEDPEQRPWFNEILKHEWFQGLRINPKKRRRRRRA